MTVLLMTNCSTWPTTWIYSERHSPNREANRTSPIATILGVKLVVQLKHIIALLTFLFFCGVFYSDVAGQDDALEPLNLRIGTWDAEITLKKADWTPLEIKSTGQTKIRWTLGDKFIETNSNYPSIASESLELVNYDEKERVYRSWSFSNSTSPRGETIGSWDAESKTLNWQADYGHGYRGKGHWKFSGDNIMEWAFKVIGPGEELLLDMEGTDTRSQ